ncbi:molybdenum cofactor guanylyltransferase [Paenibacillus beijingensis]|uniref:MobA-like NTP transferase domain-containing protein n=1 Tax=Paenibacillus beijingensis TaxID=1126833 RepID=A0A0D5NL85_9BACL|nr:molybdenum cofactor guanylyltransferase [Paenibacillus beijingensis]AJY76031.1 hypothetical protein VN24_17550 [Paenibacillus beijingensis]
MAGGQSRRMNGVMKAHLPVAGIAMIDRVSAEMNGICGKVHAVVGTEAQQRAIGGGGLSVVVESEPGRGPLPALQTGLSLVRTPLAWVSACDMPLASSKAAAYMAEMLVRSGRMAAVPFVGGRLHPLQAVYRPECLPFIRKCVSAGELRMNAFLETVDVLQITENVLEEAGIDARFVINVNRPEEYEQICRIGNEFFQPNA